MKVDHSNFEAMLNAKGINKKAFSQYAQIPYYTVAGWKKSGKVPAYVMVLVKNVPSPKTVTALQRFPFFLNTKPYSLVVLP